MHPMIPIILTSHKSIQQIDNVELIAQWRDDDASEDYHGICMTTTVKRFGEPYYLAFIYWPIFGMVIMYSKHGAKRAAQSRKQQTTRRRRRRDNNPIFRHK